MEDRRTWKDACSDWGIAFALLSSSPSIYSLWSQDAFLWQGSLRDVWHTMVASLILISASLSLFGLILEAKRALLKLGATILLNLLAWLLFMRIPVVEF